MSENKFLKCTCAQCGGHIEFPADGIGMTIPCPHCGAQTELTLAAPEQPSARSPRSLKWAIVGVVILAIGIAGTIGALVLARQPLQKRGAQPVTTPAGPRTRKADGAVRSPEPAAAARDQAPMGNGFSASEVKIAKTPGSTLVYAVGTVKNETDQQRFGVTVEIELLDDAGKKIGTAKDYKDTVEPRSEWTFRALLIQKAVATARVATVREQ